MAEEDVPRMQLACKLNPEFDADIIKRITAIPKRERSHVIRQALREYFLKRKDGDNK